MADITKLNYRMSALNEKIDTMEREHNALDALAQTRTEERHARRLNLKIQLLQLDREELHERMVAELAQSYWPSSGRARARPATRRADDGLGR